MKIRGGIQGIQLFEFWLIFLFQFSGNKIVTLESKSIIDIPDNDAIGSKKFSMERSEEISNKRTRKYCQIFPPSFGKKDIDFSK